MIPIVADQPDGHIRATILFVGDSNIAFALSAIGYELTQRDPAYQIVSTARAGLGIRTLGDYWRVRLAESFDAVRPNAVVVSLGIIDTEGPDWLDYGEKIDWFMHLIPSHLPVWWSNLPSDIEPSSRAEGCQAVNRSLEDAAQRWPNLNILDFARVARGQLDYLLPNLGGVHLSQLGALAWAREVATQLDATFPYATTPRRNASTGRQ